jgi:hypothetical protein
MTPWRFEPAALLELESAALHYDSQRSGLGREFTAAVRSALAAICIDPSANPTAGNSVRRRRVLLFPYDVIFGIDVDGVVVVAVAHHHRRPGYWRRRV